jgi:viroplasmin and RNaseH domain-containing protein
MRQAVCFYSTKMSPWYVVFRGHKPRVYSTWAECNEQVNQFPGNSHKKYPTYDAAMAAFNSTINSNFPRTDANQLCSHKASPRPTCLGVIAVLVVGVLISVL